MLVLTGPNIIAVDKEFYQTILHTITYSVTNDKCLAPYFSQCHINYQYLFVKGQTQPASGSNKRAKIIQCWLVVVRVIYTTRTNVGGQGKVQIIVCDKLEDVLSNKAFIIITRYLHLLHDYIIHTGVIH